jgi:hypothetical protein
MEDMIAVAVVALAWHWKMDENDEIKLAHGF